MAQSLANVTLHLVFSVKDRERHLTDEIRERFHAYAAGTLNRLSCPCIEINLEPDRVHIFCQLARTVSIAELLSKLKAATSGWIKDLGPSWAGFQWQGGYAAFSVSQSQIEKVRQYIRNQREHHRAGKALDFQDELRILLKNHKVAFDERYVWD